MAADRLYDALLGVLGGMAFFLGILVVTPFLDQTSIDITDGTLLMGVALFATGLVALAYSILELAEA